MEAFMDKFLNNDTVYKILQLDCNALSSFRKRETLIIDYAKLDERVPNKRFDNREGIARSVTEELLKNIWEYVFEKNRKSKFSIKVETRRCNNKKRAFQITVSNEGDGMDINDVFNNPRFQRMPGGWGNLFVWRHVFLIGVKQFACDTDGVVLEVASNNVGKRYYRNSEGRPIDSNMNLEEFNCKKDETKIRITIFQQGIKLTDKTVCTITRDASHTSPLTLEDMPRTSPLLRKVPPLLEMEARSRADI